MTNHPRRLLPLLGILLLSACGTYSDPAAAAGEDTQAAAIQATAFAWSGFVGKTIYYGNCSQYCAAINKVCSPVCTTSRGYPNWAAEAWVAGTQCTSTGLGQQTCTFMWDDVVGGPARWKCCCG